jgi:hypothetical protein
MTHSIDTCLRRPSWASLFGLAMLVGALLAL